MKKLIVAFLLSGLMFSLPVNVYAATKNVDSINHEKTEQDYDNDTDEFAVGDSDEDINTKTSKVKKGKISKDDAFSYDEYEFKPYYDRWTTGRAYNKINTIGKRLQKAAGIRKNVKYTIENNYSVNAVTRLHDNISIYKGILQYIETEDELAFVIGHELGHVYGKHVGKTIARNIGIAAVATAAGVLAGANSYGRTNQRINAGSATTGTALIGVIANKKINRNEETSADLWAVDYLVKAGYNPLGAISMLYKLSQNEIDIFRDHPAGDKRIVAAYKYIKAYYPSYFNDDYPTGAYHWAMDMIPTSRYYNRVKIKPRKEFIKTGNPVIKTKKPKNNTTDEDENL